MTIWLALLACSGITLWVIASEFTRRRARTRAVAATSFNDTLLHFTNAAVLGTTLEEAVMHASDCARASLGAHHVVLVYLTEDRSACRVLGPGLSNVDLEPEEWATFVHAPWRHAGVLERESLRILGDIDRPAGRLVRLADSLQVDLFIPGVERNTLVCVLGIGLARPPTTNDDDLIKPWVASFLPICIQRVAARYAAQQEILAREIEQAGTITQALPSEARQGLAGPLEWAVHENPDDILGGGFWNAYRLSDNRLFFIAGEIDARDLAATMLSVTIRSLCDALFAARGDMVEPGQLLTDLNRFMWRETRPMGMSCLAVLFVPEYRRALYAVAGEMSMVRLRVAGRLAVTDLLPGEGPLVGSKPDTQYAVNLCDMNATDVFFVLSEAMGDIWRGSASDTGVHLRLRIENAGTRPLDELRVALLETLGDHNRRRGNTPVVVVRERNTPRRISG